MNRSSSFASITLYFSALGVLLSGYLSYYTLFVTTGCSRALITCGGTPVKIVGVPQCVLGFVMFLAALVISLIILDSGQRRWWPILSWLGVAGSVFAGGLSVYELWVRQPGPTTMPSCVYGFFLYLGLTLTAIIAWRGREQTPTTTI